MAWSYRVSRVQYSIMTKKPCQATVSVHELRYRIKLTHHNKSPLQIIKKSGTPKPLVE
jgi:hypothetical protein